MKAKIFILFIILLFFLLPSWGQQSRFNKIYDPDTDAIYNSMVNIIPIARDKYYFSGNNNEAVNSGYSNCFFGIMSDTGKILQIKKVYIDSVSSLFNEYICISGNNFFTTFCAYNTAKDGYDVYLYYINENLDTIWTRSLGMVKYQISPHNILLNNKNNAVIIGGILDCWSGCGVKDLFWEVDTVGNTVNIDTNTQSTLTSIVQSKTDHGYICTGITYIGDNGQNFICKLDSSGSNLWSRTIGGPGYDGSLCIEFINDTTFLVSGFRRLVDHGSAYANLIKITESNRVLMDYLPSVPEVSLKEIDKIIKRGNYYYGYGYSQHVDDSVVIFCMDTSYNFVWARYYLRDRGSNVLYDFRETQDGGFIACGFVLGPLNQDGWVLKLDSLGCDVSNCWIKDTTADTATIIIPAYSSSQNIKIYPNPIRDKFQVEFEAMNIGENYSIEIKNMLGEIIFTRTLDETKSELDIHSLDAALYFYEIKNKDGVRVACGKLLKE